MNNCARIQLVTILPLFFLACSAGSAHASNREGHALSVAAGISAPSATTAPFQNPGGLIYNNKASVDAMAFFDNDQFRNPVLGGGFYAGAAGFGAGGGVLKETVTDGATSAFGGIGIGVTSLDTTVGLSAQANLSDGGGPTWNTGVLFGAHQKLRFGVTARDFLTSGHEWGGGISYDVAPDLSLILDATLDNDFKNPWLDPGILLRASSAALTVSYGFAPGTSSRGSNAIQDGFGAGASLAINPNMTLQGYYRQLNRFFFELTVKL